GSAGGLFYRLPGHRLARRKMRPAQAGGLWPQQGVRCRPRRACPRVGASGGLGDPHRRPRRRRGWQARPARIDPVYRGLGGRPAPGGGRHQDPRRPAHRAGEWCWPRRDGYRGGRGQGAAAQSGRGGWQRSGRRRRRQGWGRGDARLAKVERHPRPGPVRRAGRRRRRIGLVYGRHPRRHGRGSRPQRDCGSREDNTHRRQRGCSRDRGRGRSLRDAGSGRRRGRHRALRGPGHAKGADLFV
ncbi:Phosphoribosylformimino-5-aminoimidazole carboxamide ribotide isomerase, partial [uncultured Rubrobacteraceae bacterium]